MSVVTRFPPSPTGYFHIGSARTALFNYLFAKNKGGTMRLRFEDTDTTRGRKEYEDDIMEGLRWLGLLPETDEPAWKQSERVHVYRDSIQQLVHSKQAYEAEAATGVSDKKVIRFKNPNTDIVFTDLVRGEVSFNTADLKDFVIAKSFNEPLYHLAVVVDDYEMGVTHVIRGEDHISNTPRQILILEALGFKRPQYAHIPLILAPDRSKLSKRHGAVSVNEYRAEGYLPEALVNYLALLGWNPGGEQEIFTLDELVETFDISRVHNSGAIFNKEKLSWFNQHHIRRLSPELFAETLRGFIRWRGEEIPPYFEKVAPLLQERSETLLDACENLFGEMQGVMELVERLPPAPALILQGTKTDAKTAQTHLATVLRMLEEFKGDFFSENIKDTVFPYATKEGRGAVLWPLRVALSGREKSPDPFVIAALIGKEKTLQRIQTALRLLDGV